MPIIITTVSILAITALAWLINKLTPLKVCPICAGVAGTWLWQLGAKFLGYEINLLILAMLIGGSVVGIAYQLEKRLQPNRSPLVWKTLFVPIGFVATYSLILFLWPLFLITVTTLVILALKFTKKPKQKNLNKRVSDLENKMKNCCGFSAIGASLIVAAIIISLSWIYSNGLKYKNEIIPINTNHNQQIISDAGGVTLPITWNDLGKKMVAEGVIDSKKFESLYKEFEPLLHEARQMLYETNNKKIAINETNSSLLLNLFWALGLANKNPILENGPMTDSRYGDPSRFASTGGWTIAKGEAMSHYSRHSFISLSLEQQALVERVSQNVYRPCCDNSAYFPDCNHGMAMLGLLELLASQGFNEQEMYQTALIFNLYWFPGQYETIAKYLAMNGFTLKNANPKDILGKNLSSSSAYQKIAILIPQVQNQGNGGCDLKSQTLPSKNQSSNCSL